MAEMKAMEFTDGLTLRLARRPAPEPQEGEILIQISAAGVTPTEKLWYTSRRLRGSFARSPCASLMSASSEF